MKTRINHALLALAITAMLHGIAGAQLLIDDFSSGPYKKTLPTKTAVTDISVQKGKMLGGVRETQYLVCHQVPCNTAENEFGQTAGFQIRPSKNADVPSALIFSAGYKTFPRLDVFYGVNGDIVPLHLNLTPYDRLRVSFDGLNSVVNFNLQLYSPTGNGQLGCNLSSPSSLPFTVDFPLANFASPETIELSDITYMNMISQSGGVGDLGTMALAITRFEAVPATTPPASFTCLGN
jgi:hypothetical protein